MIIKELYFGNEKEAYIDKNFSSKFNVIFSYDNNKGKTIVMQSIIYALGGEPMFPNSFPFKDYFYVIKINQNGKDFSICRKNDTFIVKTDSGFNIFNSSAEYKYFFNKIIYPLPQIIKDGRIKIIDIGLLTELFFLPQSNRNTSNIINYGYYRKQDFENMLFSLVGLSPIDSEIDVESIKEKLDILKKEQKELQKQNKILTKITKGLNLTSLEVNRIQFEKKLEKINDLKEKITELINLRNRLTNRKIKDEMLEKELNSLNRNLPSGKLKCLDCGSLNIGYTPANAEVTFDVSDGDTRKNILATIAMQIQLTTEEIEKTSIKIEQHQKELQEELKDDNVDLATLLLVKPETINSINADKRLFEINKEIKRLDNLLKVANSNTADIIRAQNDLKKTIIEDMKSFYIALEPNGNSDFSQLYTSSASPYSGSEETEFYLAKLYSYAKNIKHDFPIIVDGFREGEIDSKAEKIILNIFKELPNQIIFTATLKDEEENHYLQFEYVNSMDYSSFEDSKILSSKCLDDFKNKLAELSIII